MNRSVLGHTRREWFQIGIVFAGGLALIYVTAFHFDVIWKWLNGVTVARTAQEQPASTMDPHTKLVNELFAGRLSGSDSYPQPIQVISWEEGSFTSKNAKEALICVEDPNRPRVLGPEELWLLRDQNGWQIGRQLAGGELGLFRIIDIENDGKSEVWISSSQARQGEINISERLLTLSPDFDTTLFEVESYDNTGVLLESGAERNTHNVQFVDLDNDGILEIADSEERTLYKGSEQSLISQEKRTLFYKLTVGKFAEIQISIRQ